MKKRLKIFLTVIVSIFSFIFINNVKALTTLDGQEFPDFPNKQYHHIIVERLNNNGYALLENSYGGNMYIDNGVIYNKNQSFKIYDLVDNSWIVRDSTNTAFSYNSIIATTVSIYSSSSLSSVSYLSGYNLFESPPFEMVFNDTSGYYKNGFYFNQSTLDYIWNQLFEGKSYNYYAGLNYNIIPSIYSSSIYFEPWKKEDFPNLACSYVNNSYFNCLFLEDLDKMNFTKDSNSYFTYSNSKNKYGNYPGFTFTTSTGEVRANTPSNSFFSFNNTYASDWYTNFDIINKDTGVTYKNKVFDYESNSKPHTFNFHLNGGTVRHNYEPFNLLFDGTKDFTIELYPNEIENFITNIEVNKYLMLFEGWYYDSNFTQPFTLNDHITTDVDLYAKFRYEKVEDFLANTTLNMHTFDDNYNYAIINRGDNGDSVYIGLPFEAYNLEVYEYSESEYKVKDGASACPVPLYSKNGYYYYDINTLFTNNQEVLILPRTLFDELDPNNFENPNDIYNFYLSNNGYISYTNDLSQAQIINSSGEQISINLQDSYELSQQYQELYSKPENIFEQMNIFLDKMKKITSAVKDIFSYLFNSLNSTIKSFITYLIIIILVTAIIRFARRG